MKEIIEKPGNFGFVPTDEELVLVEDMAKTYQNDFNSYFEAYDHFYEKAENNFYNN